MTAHDLHVEIDGPPDAPPLLLLHGWGSSAANMRPLARSLSDAYRTYAVDLPGHGASPPPPTPWGVPEHGRLVRDLLRDRIERPATVIGHSNGGRIALHMATTHDLDQWIERLVLVSPSGVRPERSWAQVVRSGIATTLKTPIQALPSPLREPAEDWLRHTLVWRWLGSSDYNATAGVMRETFVKTVNFHVDEGLHRIHVPTLLFWGTEDTAVSRRQMDTLASEIEDCGLVELEGAGHYGHLDDIDTVHSGIRYFLEHT